MSVDAAIAALFREEWGRLVATLIRTTGDWELAEDCAQDAFAQALRRWPEDGIPPRPGAWLMTTARNKAVDRLRRAAVGAAKLRELAVRHDPPNGSAAAAELGDDRLALIFTCCHPALTFEARVALTLRVLTGLTTAQIARAFLVSEDTMSKRLTRARSRIRAAGVPFRVPPAAERPGRLNSVLGVLYLLFNEGYAASGGEELIRRDLSDEAIRLGRLLTRLLPDEPEAAGLLALMTLHDARRPARLDGRDLVPLEEQDRSRWDHGRIAEGVALLDGALSQGRPGPYQVQAAIAACHATAPSFERTSWAEIAGLYGHLERLVPSATVRLNRAVAVGMLDPARGLALLDALSPGLRDRHLLPAARADLLRRQGRPAEAAVAYREAIPLAPTEPERRYLARRLAEVFRGTCPADDGPFVGGVQPEYSERAKTMYTTRSADGTTIAFDRLGSGDPVVLVSGASCARGIHAELAGLLADGRTVLNYDRRGRGDSGDTAPYAVDREIEDLAAVIDEAGGSAAVFGNSSGAVLALRAAAAGLPITRLALWEPPFQLDPGAPGRARAYGTELTECLADDRRGDAMALFMRSVGMPPAVLGQMRRAPMWAALEAVAPTLAYDAAVMGDGGLPPGLADVKVPTLVLTGSASGPWADTAAQALLGVLPGSRHTVLEGQNHNVSWDALAPHLVSFLA